MGVALNNRAEAEEVLEMGYQDEESQSQAKRHTQEIEGA
jgi:hypothetical protein